MADAISIISRSVQDGCEKLLHDWMGELSKAQMPDVNTKDKHYTDWIQSHPVSAKELGHQTTLFKKMLDDDHGMKYGKYNEWRRSFENASTLHLIDDLWDMVANCVYSCRALADSSGAFLTRLDAHDASYTSQTADHVVPQFSPCLAYSYDEATLSIELPPKMTSRLQKLAHEWAIATLKVYLLPNLLHQLNDRDKKVTKLILDRLGYAKVLLSDQELLRAMCIAPDFLISGQTKSLKEAIFSEGDREGDNVVFILALLITSVPHSFIVHLQILKVLPAPQLIIAQSLTDVLRTMVTKSATIRAQRNGDTRQLFIEWLDKVFARETLHSLVHRVRQLVECALSSCSRLWSADVQSESQEQGLDGLGTEHSQVLFLLRLRNSFLAFRKLLAPMPGSTSVLCKIDGVCSSLQVLNDFHIFSRAAQDRLKNRNRVRENISLSVSLHSFSLPSIYPFYFENLRLPGSAMSIPILISHEAVVSIGNSETVFFSESFRVDDQSLILKPILISPCASVPSSSHLAATCTFESVIESDIKHLPTHFSKIVVNWGTAMPENDPFLKAQKFNYWFIAVQCARVAFWILENSSESGELSRVGFKGSPKISCAYRWFPKEAICQIQSFVGLCTQVNESIRENAADVLRARGFNMSDINLETAPVLSACVANVIAASATMLHNYNASAPHHKHASRNLAKSQLKIDKPSQLQDHISGICKFCYSLMQSSIDQIQSMIKSSSISCVAFQRHSLLFEGITLDDLRAHNLQDLDSNETECDKIDVMMRVCAADTMFLRIFDVFDHHSPLIPSTLLRLPGAGGIPFLNFPELRLRRLCEKVHLSKLIKDLSKQLNQPGPLQEKLVASYDRIRTAGLFLEDKIHIIDHLVKPRKDMGGNSIVGKLHDGVADEQLILVAHSIWETICSPEYSKRLDQLLSAQYPIEFGIRLRLLVEPLCTILQTSSSKDFGADDIIPLTEFVFSFVFAPRAMSSSSAYLYWIAKLCVFKEMLNDELAQGYLQTAEGLIHAHTKNNCQHQNWQRDIPAVKKCIQQLLTEKRISSLEGGPNPSSNVAPFQETSSDDDDQSDAVVDATATAGDSLSASQLAGLALLPRMRGTMILDDDVPGSEMNVQFNELTRSCIKRNTLLQTLHQAHVVKNHTHLYKVMEDCLCASEAIDMMVHLKFCESRADAIRIGKLMVADGLISPVGHSKPFADKSLLFRCVKPVVFESSLTITSGFFEHTRHFALYAKSSDYFTLCWYKDSQKTEVRGELCIYPSSVIRPVNEMDFELSHVLETKKGYGLINDSKCFKVQANSKQLRDRWVEELTQAQKRVAVAVPEKGLRVNDEPRPSFFQPSSFVDRQRETVSSMELEDLPAAPPVSDGSGDVLGSNSSPLLSAMQPAAIESDHVFYRGAHLSFNDFLLTASSESEWYLIQFVSLSLGRWH